MLDQLLQFYFCHGHEGVDFVFRAFKVLDAEGVDCDGVYAGFVAHFEDLP
jgi:hypothetical protein